MPRLTILQAPSPQIKKGERQIPGAEIGDFCLVGPHIGKEGLCKNGVTVIACDERTEHIHWPKGHQGGQPIRNYYEDATIL